MKNVPWVPLLLLSSAWLSTHSNSLTSPETICVMTSHGPSLFPAPGVTQLPNFSGTVPASSILPAVTYCLFISPARPGDFPASLQISSVPVLKHPLHTLASKLHTAGIMLAIHSVFWKISWVSQLGTLASGLSSHLHHHHLPASLIILG